MNNVSVDKKLQVAQLIRAESRENRMRMRSREKLVYGKTAVKDEPPLYARSYESFGGEMSELYGLEDREPAKTLPRGTFKLRLLLAAALFAAFLIMDRGGYKFMGVSTDEVAGMIGDTGWQEELSGLNADGWENSLSGLVQK